MKETDPFLPRVKTCEKKKTVQSTLMLLEATHLFVGCAYSIDFIPQFLLDKQRIFQPMQK